jgi:integrase
MYRRGRVWWATYRDDAGRYRCESSGSTNRRVAQKLEDMRRAAVVEGRLRLPKSNPPTLEDYANGFLETIKDAKTNARYTSSVRNLVAFFGKAKLSQVTSERIQGFQQARLKSGVGPATINRDLAVLRRMLKLGALQRLIGYNPMSEVEFLEERKHRRQPHILTFEEQARLIAVAPPHMKMLTVLITETGLRVGKEALPLKWEEVDLLNDAIHVRQSKTAAGIRIVPLSEFCKSELLEWRGILGSGFSDYVFPNFNDPTTHLGSVKKAWRTALNAAEIPYFPIYNLRATFASRLSASGTPDLFVAQMMGHSGTSILHVYAKAIDESRREAIKKLEAYRHSHCSEKVNYDASPIPQPDASNKHPWFGNVVPMKKPVLN